LKSLSKLVEIQIIEPLQPPADLFPDPSPESGPDPQQQRDTAE
jgi:hypothetical protein